MKALSSGVLIIGAASLIIGIILRFTPKPITLGLEPSSFLQFSIATSLLAIAIEIVSQKKQ